MHKSMEVAWFITVQGTSVITSNLASSTYRNWHEQTLTPILLMCSVSTACCSEAATLIHGISGTWCAKDFGVCSGPFLSGEFVRQSFVDCGLQPLRVLQEKFWAASAGSESMTAHRPLHFADA